MNREICQSDMYRFFGVVVQLLVYVVYYSTLVRSSTRFAITINK